MSGFTIAWIMWLVMFGVIEGVALARKETDDTLTEHIRKWFSTRDKAPWWLARRGVLAVFLVWLTAHFLL